MPMNKQRGRGRPSGDSDAREQILQAGGRLFLASGYRGVSLRSIAAEAGVDSALISYYFGSKRGLFAAIMRLTVSPPDVVRRSLQGDPAHLPERIVINVLAVWDDPVLGGPLVTLFRLAGSDPDASRLVRELIEGEILGAIAGHLGGREASARAAIAASQIAGLIFMRHVLRAEPVATMPLPELARHAAPAVRAALFARHPALGGGP
jgi:AcrR family transcriptional regulator